MHFAVPLQKQTLQMNITRSPFDAGLDPGDVRKAF